MRWMLAYLIVFRGDSLHDYRWLERYDAAHAVVRRIAPPPGYDRVTSEAGTFAAWLRHLPLKPRRPAVMLYDGTPKSNQNAHHAVLDIDVGKKDLQQCADAIIRLRAEYLYATGQTRAIQFEFTSGDNAEFMRWSEGYRPVVRGNRVSWVRSAEPDASYRSFRAYLETVFIYAGSASLSRQLRPVPELDEMQIGEVFIQGGFPGHAVLVLDMAVHRKTNERVFLLAQSFMPAQDIHIVRNPNDTALDPWYRVRFGDTLQTPEWDFDARHLRRFGGAR